MIGLKTAMAPFFQIVRRDEVTQKVHRSLTLLVDLMVSKTLTCLNRQHPDWELI